MWKRIHFSGLKKSPSLGTSSSGLIIRWKISRDRFMYTKVGMIIDRNIIHLSAVLKQGAVVLLANGVM